MPCPQIGEVYQYEKKEKEVFYLRLHDLILKNRILEHITEKAVARNITPTETAMKMAVYSVGFMKITLKAMAVNVFVTKVAAMRMFPAAFPERPVS